MTSVSGGDYRSLSDEDLVQLVQQGDMNAADELYGRYRGKVTTMLYGKIWHPGIDITEDVKDITMQIFERVFEKIDLYSKNRGKFTTWFWTIALHEIDSVTRRRFQKKYGFTDEGPLKLQSLDAAISGCEDITLGQTIPEKGLSPYDQAVLMEIINTLYRLIENIKNDNQKIAITLRFICCFSVEEISEILGRKISTVKSDLKRAIDSVEKQFTDIWKGEYDPDEIRRFAREGGLMMGKKDLEKVSNLSARKALLMRVFEGKKYQEIAKKLNCSVKDVTNLVLKGISQLLEKKIERKIVAPLLAVGPGKMENEDEQLSRYIDNLFAGETLERRLRAEPKKESPHLRSLKKMSKMLYCLLGRRYQKKEVIRSLGALVSQRIEDLGINLDDLGKKLNYDEHQVMKLLNDRIEIDKTILKRLSKILNVPQNRLSSLAEISRPTMIYSGETRREPSVDWARFDQLMKQKIHRILKK